jgi:acyl carrier protein
MVGYCANTLGMARETIDPNVRFDQLGMESMMLVIMTEELEKSTGQEIDPASPYDHSTINQLALHVSQLTRKDAPRTDSKTQ